MKSDIEYKPLDDPNKKDTSFDIKKKKPQLKEQGFVYFKDRKTTDFWGVICFIPTMIIFAVIGLDGYFNGNTIKLTAPYDGAGNFCGVGDMEGYPYLMFDFEELDPWSPPTPQLVFQKTVCVKECPEHLEEGENPMSSLVDCKTNSFITQCPNKKFLSYPMMKICVPKTGDEIPPQLAYYKDMIQGIYVSSMIPGFLNDLDTCWHMVIFSVVLSFVICSIYIELMSLFAETMSWICLIFVQISLIAASIGSFFLKYYIKDQTDYMIKHKYPDSMIGSMEYATYGCYVMCAAFAIFSVVYAVTLCSNYKNLKFAIDVIDASADFLADNRKIYFSACFFNLLCLTTIILWIACCYGVYSQGEIKADALFPQYRLVDLDAPHFWKLLFLFLAMIWLKEFFEVMNMFIVMYATVTYYNWKGPNEDERVADLGQAYKCAVVKHIGSIAIGAPILAFINFLKFVTMAVSEKIGNTFSSANSHLSDEVFAYIAVSGDNFCSSSSDNYVLQNKHQKQFSFTNKIAKVFIFLGKLAICFLNVWLTRITMRAAGVYDNLAAPMGMSLFVGLLSFTNASMFLCVFDAAVIGMMSCAAIDMDNNDGRPTRGPPTFHEKIKKIKEQTELDEDGNPVRVKKANKNINVHDNTQELMTINKD